MDEQTIHPFELAGLGKAPFRYDGMEEKVHNNGDGTTKAGGSCQYCWTGIRWCFWIKSSDGKRFYVGSDCVAKLGRADNKLISEVNRAIALKKREKKQAERAAKWAAACLKRDQTLAAERAANGGLTNAEVEAKKRAEADAIRYAEVKQKNGWLIDVLLELPRDFGFVDDMIEKLGKYPLKSMSDRQKAVLCKIYAKQVSGKSRGKAFDEACNGFDLKAEEIL